MKKSIWIGFDPRWADAFAVARESAFEHAPTENINGVVLADLRERGWYRRPTSMRDGRLWDDISEAPMATEFAISRFLAPIEESGLALFMDCDVLIRHSLKPLFDR